MKFFLAPQRLVLIYLTPQGLSSTKLVFHRDVEMYRNWVSEFYAKLEAKENLPSDQDMSMLYHSMQNVSIWNQEVR